MKVLSVVYDDILADPRASKFKNTLLPLMQIRNLSVKSVEGERDENDIIYVKKGKGRFTELFRYWMFIYKTCRRVRPDIILGHNYYVAFPCIVISRLFKAKFVYDAYELYVPEKRMKFSFRYYLFYYLERFAIKGANLVFSANVERSRLMKAVYKLEKLPIPILNIPMISSDKKIEDKVDSFVVVYEGGITFSRHLKLLLETINYLPDNFSITFIGDGPNYEELRMLISKNPHKDRIRCLGRVLNKDIIPLLSRCSLGFVGYPLEGLNNNYCSPNKIYEYPAAGIPFISTDQAPIYSITSGYNICEFFNPNKDSALDVANLITKIASNYNYYCENIQKFNIDHSWDNESVKIKNAFMSLKE